MKQYCRYCYHQKSLLRLKLSRLPRFLSYRLSIKLLKFASILLLTEKMVSKDYCLWEALTSIIIKSFKLSISLSRSFLSAKTSTSHGKEASAHSSWSTLSPHFSKMSTKRNSKIPTTEKLTTYSFNSVNSLDLSSNTKMWASQFCREASFTIAKNKNLR